MKILLVALNAKYIHSNLAVYSLKAYACKQDMKYTEHISLVEYTINQLEEDILKEIYLQKAEVVAFSCYLWNIDMITRIIRDLRKVAPNTKIWFGGPEVSYDAQTCLELYQDLDAVSIGEGEQTFLEIAEYYIDGTRELESIKGIAYKESAKKHYDHQSNREKESTVTPLRLPLSLDSIPFPYKDMKSFENKIIYYESSRGCPFSCTYCLSSIDKRVRLRSTELVKTELKFLMDQQVPQIKFVDRTFNCNKQHAMDIWKFIKENDNGITNFHFEISADLMEEDEIEFLATLRPGHIQFEIDVQTTNAHTVDAIQRKMNLEKLSKNVARIKEGGNIHQHLDLIAGLPLEDYHSFENSFNDVYLMKPDQFQLGFLKVLKGSQMEEDSSTYGITYKSTAPYEVLFTKYLSYDELLIIKGICEMVEVYYNSGQFMFAMNYMEHFFDSAMEMYHQIHLYYETKKLAHIAHTRLKKYEILLDFYEDVLCKKAKNAEEESVNLFKEILMMDLFLREDRKSRPSFAPKQPENINLREVYSKYSVEHKQIHIEYFTYDVIASSQTGKAVKKPTAFLFDYENKDPLNNSAKLIPII
ncbi:MAG: B12-binding domain-containing radical SAM protein [Mobilitalea sp.]